MRRSIGRVLLLTLSGALLLAGCGGGHPTPPAPDLHLPGLLKIRAFDALAHPDNQGLIHELATYAPANRGGTPHVLALMDHAVYDVSTDGSGLRSLSLTEPCDFGLSALDSQWAVCRVDEPTLSDVEFTPLANAPREAGRPIVTRIEKGALYNGYARALYNGYVASLTWSPDGQEVAVLTNEPEACTMALYRASASATYDAYDAFALLAVLTFPDFEDKVTANDGSVSSGCMMYGGLTWSPDGDWIAFLANGALPGSIYGVYLPQVVPQLFHSQAASTPVTKVVQTTSLVALGQTYQLYLRAPPAWSSTPQGLALTFVSDQERLTIVRRHVATGAETTVLAVPSSNGGYVSALAWTPDGRHLAFVLDTRVCGDCGPVPSQVYVYTPPDA